MHTHAVKSTQAVQPPASTDPNSAETNVDALSTLYYLDVLCAAGLKNPNDPDIITEIQNLYKQLAGMVAQGQITDPTVLAEVKQALSVLNSPNFLQAYHNFWTTPPAGSDKPPAVDMLSVLSNLGYNPINITSDTGNTMFLTSMVICDVETLAGETYFPSTQLNAFLSQVDNSGNCGYAEMAYFLNTYASNTPGLSQLLKEIMPTSSNTDYNKFYQIFESGESMPDLNSEILAFAQLSQMLYQQGSI